MGRITDSTIKGFMYQFNLSLNEILKSTDKVIRIEGIIENIDKIDKENITAIQCKYHEKSEKFQWSMVYKPILQMIKTFSGLEKDTSNISFILYAFFPSEKIGKKVSKDKTIEMINTRSTQMNQLFIAQMKRTLGLMHG